MININQTNIADVDINLAATLLIIGVFVMTLRKRSDKKKADAAYLGLVIATLVVCVCGLVSSRRRSLMRQFRSRRSCAPASVLAPRPSRSVPAEIREYRVSIQKEPGTSSISQGFD